MSSLYYCSLLLIGVTLFQIVNMATLTPDQKRFTLAPGISGNVSGGSLLFRHQNF